MFGTEAAARAMRVRRHRDEATQPSSTREVGVLGTASRVVGGVVAVIVPLLVWGATPWDWAAGLVGFPLLATAAGAAFTALHAPTGLPDVAMSWSARWGTGLALVAGVLAGATAVTYVTPVDGTAIWIFLGASMLLAAAKGYAGCEVLAFPSAITGRRYEAGCLLYGAIDAAEVTRRKASRPSERRGRIEMEQRGAGTDRRG